MRYVIAKPIPLPSFLVVKYKSKILSRTSGRNAATLVMNAEQRHAAVFGQPHCQLAALRHGLGAIQHDVQQRLLQQVRIHLGQHRAVGQIALHMHVAGFEFGGGQHQHRGDNAAQILLLQLQLHRAGEIHQRLHHPVQSLDLALDDFQVTHGPVVGVAQLVTQQFQVHHDGIDGILDLVTDARRQSSDGGQASRELQIAFYFPDRFHIVQGEQRAQGFLGIDRAIVMDKVERDLDVPAGLGGDLLLHQGHAGVERLAHQPAQAGYCGRRPRAAWRPGSLRG